MNEKKNEVDYLLSKIDKVKYDAERFKIKIGTDKYLFGFTDPKGENENVSKYLQIRALYNSIVDLDYKIKYSLKEAIRRAYSDKMIDDFKIFSVDTTEELETFYYIENAVFRTSILWDMLAQLYRVLYNININYDRVHYKQIFDTSSNKYCTEFIREAEVIFNYINENDNIDGNQQWRGNHKYVNILRNQLTHRNSPNISVITDLDTTFKVHPTFQLKRIVEDYATVSKYIEEILLKCETLNNKE